MNRHWMPLGALERRIRAGEIPEPGQLIAWVADRRAWRVVEVTDRNPAQWHESTRQMWERAGMPDVWDGRERALLIEPPRDPQPNGNDRRGVRLYPWAREDQWFPLYDPWPECVDCGLLWPCPCKDRNDAASAAMADLRRLEGILPGCCWACGRPITGRQHSVVFEGENLLLPGAGSPAFHVAGAHKPDRVGSLLGGSATCRGAAIAYEKRWVDAWPGRVARLTCPGVLFRHYESYECTAAELCSGFSADHVREVHCSSLLPLIDGDRARPARSCGGKGCRGGAA